MLTLIISWSVATVKPLTLPPHPITTRKFTDIHGLLYRLGLVWLGLGSGFSVTVSLIRYRVELAVLPVAGMPSQCIHVYVSRAMKPMHNCRGAISIAEP